MKIARITVRVEFARNLNLRGSARPKTPLKESLCRQLIQKNVACGLEHFDFIHLARPGIYF
jgi:hypothetical protein